MEQQPNVPPTEAKKDVYTLVTEKIIEQLEKGTVPWRKPWKDGAVPRNTITRKQYRGINVVLLGAAGYVNNEFLTYKQLQEIGGKVRRGEKGHMVVFWKVTDQQSQTETDVVDTESKNKIVLRYYIVFNIAQCEHVPEKYLSTSWREEHPMPACDAVVERMPLCPPIKYSGRGAFYNVASDFVNMPKKKNFETDESFYSTLFHELVHSTGHEKRLKRPGLMAKTSFGSETYSQEELVAEIGAAYLQSLTGITAEFEQSAAYIQGWLTTLRNDKRCIVMAANASQKAVDYILNVQTAP